MAKSKASKRSPKAAKRSVKTAKATRQAPRKSAKAARKAASKPARKTAKKKKAAPRRVTKTVSRKVAKKAPRRAATAARKAQARKIAPRAPAVESRQAARARTAAALGRKPNLDRERRIVREEDELVTSPPSSLDLDRSASAARTGRQEYEERLRLHTSTSPALTGGDVDANWEDAETVGDEAPGGDSPTPDQDVVDEIGKALGIEYEDDEELQGGDELAARDRHRWELDPASKDDSEEE